jgi:hypothetical protein
VVDRDGNWGGRFDLVLQAAITSGDVIELDHAKDDPNVFTATNEAILDEAVHQGSTIGLRTLAMVVWDGVSRGADDITKAFLNQAQCRKLEVIAVPTM